MKKNKTSDLNIAYVTEMGLHGRLRKDFKDFRTVESWIYGFNAFNIPFKKLETQNLEEFDLFIVIIPKNNVGVCKKVIDLLPLEKTAIMQEGPCYYFQDCPAAENLKYVELLEKCKFILCHNIRDTDYFSQFNDTCVKLPTCCDTQLEFKRDEYSKSAMMFGTFSSWYNGQTSYRILKETGFDVWMPMMGRFKKDEGIQTNNNKVKVLGYLPWFKFMEDIKNISIGCHMMPTMAASSYAIHCLDLNTEVLTMGGVKKIEDCSVGEKVLSINKDTNDVEYKKITNVFTRNLKENEKMYSIQGKSVNFIANSEHDFVLNKRKSTHVKSWWSNTIETIKTKDLIKRKLVKFPTGNSISGVLDEKVCLTDYMSEGFVVFKIKPCEFRKAVCWDNYVDIVNFSRYDFEYSIKSSFVRVSLDFYRKHREAFEKVDCKKIVKFKMVEYANEVPLYIDTSDFLFLAGLYLSEGSSRASGQVNIAQSRIANQNKYDEIRSKLAWLNNNGRKHNIEIQSPVLSHILGLNFGNGFLNKKIPFKIFKYDYKLLKFLYDGLMIGDGSSRGNAYFTSSEQLKSDFMKLCVHLGYGVSYSKNSNMNERIIQGTITKPTTINWRINIRRERAGNMLGSQGKSFFKEEADYSKKIGCISVEDNATFLGGLDGKFQWIGNCAMLSIPCICSPSDVSRDLFPLTTCRDPYDYAMGSIYARRLVEDKEFLNAVIRHAKDNVYKYDFRTVCPDMIKKFKEILKK